MQAIAVTIPDAMLAAQISRSTIYEEIGKGRLRAFKIGRATRIRVEDLRAWLDSRPAIKPHPPAPRSRRGKR